MDKQAHQTYFLIFCLMLPIYHSKPAVNVHHFVVSFPQLRVATAW